MQEKLLLNQARNLDSERSNMTIPVDITVNNDIIVDDRFNEVVNQYNVYLDEREECTTVRLTAKVNLVASNIIFNSVTEIVKNEGADDCKCLNYNPVTIPSTIGKGSTYEWGSSITDAVMDTQITFDGKQDKNYTYLCGIDIFNNHVLRSKTKFPVYYGLYAKPMMYFNTIKDIVRDTFKINGIDNRYKNLTGVENIGYVHRYSKDNLMTFEESVEKNLINNEGWIGFMNKGHMHSLYDDEPFGVENVINNIRTNRFIDLFPGRDRYSIMPHYNEYKRRLENNWEYCLMYPRDMVKEGIPFINQSLDTLKIGFIDETSHDDDEVYRCTVYSVSKHGLVEDDTINLYRSRDDDDSDYELVEGELIVDTVIDDYTFTVYTSDWVCRKWISILDKDQLTDEDIIHLGGGIYIKRVQGGTDKRLLAVNDYINADFDTEDSIGSQNLSFAKTVNGQQCEYYVRVFSRLPNFSQFDKELNEENIYSPYAGTGKLAVDYFSEYPYEFSNTITKLGFSKNAYGNDVAQVVFEDDIEINYIKDNLGRPITNLYMMFFKTNYGYKDWYNANEEDRDISAKEWSRCFGKLNCGFEYSPHIDEHEWSVGNIRIMNNVTNIEGLNQNMINGNVWTDDEIEYKNDTSFYGDLCCYSRSECLEMVLQDCLHRFNTAQRELGPDNGMFTNVMRDEIQYDDNDIGQSFDTTQVVYDNSPCQHPEGYFYKPSYVIPIRTFSSNVMTFEPDFIDITAISMESPNYTITTAVENNIDTTDKLYLYDISGTTSYRCTIINILDLNKVMVTIEDSVVIDISNVDNYQLFLSNMAIPDYAEMMPDGDCSYRWREVVQNGFEDMEGIIREYPFTNGCLYVNADINLFLRRQDPFGEYGLSSESVYFGMPAITGERNPVEYDTAENVNDAYKESNIKC